MLERMRAWIAERENKRRESYAAEYKAGRERYALEWDGNELRTVETGIECRVLQRVAWAEIAKIVAFKLDCMYLDHVVMILETKTAKTPAGRGYGTVLGVSERPIRAFVRCT